MKRTWQTRVAAIGGITTVELYALHLGHNGLLLSLSVAAIAGVAGYEIGAERIQSLRHSESDEAS